MRIQWLYLEDDGGIGSHRKDELLSEYPLVMTNIAIENHHFLWKNPLFKWPFSIAMLNYQRVAIDIVIDDGHSYFSKWVMVNDWHSYWWSTVGIGIDDGYDVASSMDSGWYFVVICYMTIQYWMNMLNGIELGMYLEYSRITLAVYKCLDWRSSRSIYPVVMRERLGAFGVSIFPLWLFRMKGEQVGATNWVSQPSNM